MTCEKIMVDLCLTTDPACAAPEEGAERGEQPDEQLKKLVTEIGSERPHVERGKWEERAADRETGQTAQ